MAATVYYRQVLTGGTSTALDEVDGAVLNDGDPAFVMTGTTVYMYVLDATSGAAESSPDVISPDTNPGNKRWILQSIGIDVAGTAREYTKTQNFNATTLTDGATISWDLESNQVTSVTLGGNRTMAAPTNIVDGAYYTIRVIQDATGSRTLTWNSAYEFAAEEAPTLSVSANAVDHIAFRGVGTTVLEEVGRSIDIK